MEFISTNPTTFFRIEALYPFQKVIRPHKDNNAITVTEINIGVKNSRRLPKRNTQVKHNKPINKNWEDFSFGLFRILYLTTKIPIPK